MSVLQSTQKKLRFLQRKNLEEESRIIGNYYSDLISQFGIDCVYYKINTKVFGDFKNIIDQNTILKHAYAGYDSKPDYTCSAEMITFPEVQADIFQLNKIGMVPDVEVDFYFDSKQFACDLASKCGQLKEYTIDDIVIDCDVPEYKYHYIISSDEYGNLISVAQPNIVQIELDKKIISCDVNEGTFPYKLGLGMNEHYSCGVMSGKLSVSIDNYEYDVPARTICHPYEHTDFKVMFPKNSDLYASLQYEICNTDYIETLIFLDYVVNKTYIGKDQNGNDIYKSILHGKITGSILFYDITAIGKYLELIHPEVGDVLAIDFPDENNRERYQITDCYDKSLQSDGISPLLHKYIWKCKAKRYIDSYEESAIQENEADERMEEKLKYDQAVEEQITEKISKYDEGDQEAYGGYDGVVDRYDKQIPNPYTHEKYDYLSDGECIDIIRFASGSRLVTNGYDLIFIIASVGGQPGDGYIVAKNNSRVQVNTAYFECGLRWLKATDEKIVFINIQGEANTLVEDEIATQNEIQMCLNDLNEKTLDVGEINMNNDNFLKFKGTRSYIWSDGQHLYAKLQSNSQLYKLV